MGTAHEPSPAALTIGITFADREALDEAMELLRSDYGPMEFASPEFVFDMTDYYIPEMGENLRKQFFCFRDPISLEMLPGIKHRTNAIEQRLARMEGNLIRRRVNLDPGYVTLAKLVLATTKDYSHRVYIGEGMYAETTLRFVRGVFAPFETTYPDHQTPLALEFFNAARDYVKRSMPLWAQKNV
jgi:hypothetical protein